MTVNFADELNKFMARYASDCYSWPWDWLTWLNSSLRAEGPPTAEEGFTTIGETLVVGQNFEVQPYIVITGTVFIGEGTRIGPFTFLRGPLILGSHVSIGPHCEIARSIVMDSANITHADNILDSIIGSGVLLAGRINAANTAVGRDYIKLRYNGEVQTTTDRRGCLIENDATLGAGTFLMPGCHIGQGSRYTGQSVIYGDGLVRQPGPGL
jgi:NDP-sugar pyrophosphorylase family protein